MSENQNTVALIKMENGEKITLEEYNRRSRLELEEREKEWQQKFKNPHIVEALKKALEVVKRRLSVLTTKLEQLEEDDRVLMSLDELHEKEMGWKSDEWVAGRHFRPFSVYIYHHSDLRKKLKERIGEYKTALQQLHRLKKGKLGEARDAKLEQFISPF